MLWRQRTLIVTFDNLGRNSCWNMIIKKVSLHDSWYKTLYNSFQGSELFFKKLTVAQKSRKTDSFLWNANVHYRIHKSPPLGHILNQMNRVHTIISCLILSSNLSLSLSCDISPSKLYTMLSEISHKSTDEFMEAGNFPYCRFAYLYSGLTHCQGQLYITLKTINQFK